MEQSRWHDFASWRRPLSQSAHSGVALVLACLLQLSSGLAQTPAPAPPPPDLKIVVLEGSGAINNIRQHRAKDPVIQVVDETGAPVKGASVTFLLPATGPSAVFGAGGRTLTVLTDEKGTAAGPGLGSDHGPGEFEDPLVGKYRGPRTPAVIKQTKAPPPQATRPGSSQKI